MTARRAQAADVVHTDRGPRWIEYLPVADVQPAASNPKAHDAPLLDRSVATYGFTEPPLVDERTGRLIAGHGRLEALQRAEALPGPPVGDDGQPVAPWPPEGVVVDDGGRWLLPVIRGWSSRDDDHARGYLIVANRAPETGGWQQRSLAEYLHDLDESAGTITLADVGYTRDDYDQLLQSTGLAGELAGGFLDDIAGQGNGDQDTEPARGQGTDVVDLRLPMADRERDEAVALLRKHQRALADVGRPAGTLSAAALEILRTWTP